MAGQQFIPHGTAVTFSSDDVGGLVDIVPPEQTRGDVRSTDNDSGGNEEYFPGLREGGTLSLIVKEIHDDAGQTALRTNYNANLGAADAVEEVVITYPSAADDSSPVQTLTFDAYVNRIGLQNMSQQANEPQMREFILKVTGGITFASA